MQEYHKSGQVVESVNGIIFLIVGVGIGTLMLIFVGVLGGQVYSETEADITAISNATIETSVRNSIASGFEALETTGGYMPLLVLAVIITIVMSLVLGMGSFGGGRSAYGGAL